MAPTRTKQRELWEADRPVEAAPQAASWSTLYRAAGVAALITAVLIPIQLAVFVAYPFPADPRVGGRRGRGAAVA